MIVAYLMNQYPLPTLSFIRREIAALEARGVGIRRFALRRWEGQLVDPADLTELEKTRFVLDGGAVGLAVALIGTALAHPLRFAKAFSAAIALGRRALRGSGVHLVYLAEACVLLRWLRASGATHLHSHFGTNSTTVAMLCRLLGGPAYSFTLHGPQEFDQPESLGLGVKTHHAAFVAAISEYARSQLFRWSEWDDWAKIRVIRCGVDREFLRSPDVPPPIERRLVCVARIGASKGHLVLIDAAARVAAEMPDFELVLVGDGPMRAIVEERIAMHGLGRQVKILGWKSNAEVLREVVASRAFVLPSFAEGLPVVFMEALALRRPVLSTYIAGIPELVEPGVSGWLVPSGAIEPLARAMLEILRMPVEDLHRMGRTGAVRVARDHDVEKEAARLAGLFASPASALDSGARLLESAD